MAIIREFGGVQLILAECKNCGEEGFVIDGKCGVCLSPIKIKKKDLPSVKESTGEYRRKNTYTPKPIRGICTYCRNPIGSRILKYGKKEVVLRPEWDHFVPFGFAGSNKTDYILSCHICNKIKLDKLFSSVEEAQKFIKRKWKKLGHTPLHKRETKDGTNKKDEEDEEIMENWSVEFAHPVYWLEMMDK